MNTKHAPIGWTYWADCYCADCGGNLPTVDPEGNEKHPIFSWDDYGTDWSCGDCKGEI